MRKLRWRSRCAVSGVDGLVDAGGEAEYSVADVEADTLERVLASLLLRELISNGCWIASKLRTMQLLSVMCAVRCCRVAFVSCNSRRSVVFAIIKCMGVLGREEGGCKIKVAIVIYMNGVI